MERKGTLNWFLLGLAAAFVAAIGLTLFAISVAKYQFWGSALLQPATLVTILYIRLFSLCCGGKMVRSQSPYWRKVNEGENAN